jgi:tetratricopeptide (TPR) repeat protein
MQKIRSFFSSFMGRYLSSSKQIQRIILFSVVALVLAIGSFAGYYYFDRFYSTQPDVTKVTLEQAEQAVQADPANLEAHMTLAETYMLYQRYDDALAQAIQVFSADPTNKGSWLVMGVASQIIGKPADAISPLTNYVDAYKDEEMPGLDRRLQEAAYYLGLSYLDLGQPDKAIPVLEQTVGWSQLDADALFKLGTAYAAVQRYEDAVNVYVEATKYVPNFTEAYQAMADAYDAGGKQGLSDYARGMVAYSQKDYQAALTLLLQASTAYPQYAPIFAGMGLNYESLNDLKNAKTSYDTALSLDPNNYTAQRGADRVAALLKQ